MSKRRNRNAAGSVLPASEGATALATPAPVHNALAVQNGSAIQNGLGDALGIGFPQNQGAPWSEQLSQPTTMFKNLRWYLVSNDRQFLCELYVEIGLVQTIVDVPVDDALRGGIEIKSKQLDELQIEELKISVDRDDDLNVAGQAAKWNRLFGGAGILVIVGDQDPEMPLDLPAIGPDTKVEFRAVDMWELFWDKQSAEGYDPTLQEDNFEFYNYYGERVHKSRVMRLKGLTAPSFIRPRLRGWGFSIVEALVRAMNQYLKSTDLAFEVLDEFKIDVFKIKNLVDTLMSPNGEAAIRKRVQLANFQKNYQNALTMDAEDDWDHKELSFAGLGEAMQQIRMQVAADMRMPLTKLFGISAAGFNSGEDDIEVYNAMVESQVRNKLKYDILRMLEIKCQKLFGFIPDDLSIAFKPLRVMSSEQEETVKTQKFTRLIQAKQAGELTTIEFRDACNKGDLFDVKLDTDDDTLDDVADEATDIGEDPDKGAGGDEPGADREDSQKTKALLNWDESKHPRDDDGKFGAGGGGESGKGGSVSQIEMAQFRKKHPYSSGNTFHSRGSNDEAKAAATKLRAEGIHATIWHIEGPKTGPKSKYFVMVPESKKNDENCTPLAHNERVARVLGNSAAFDRASYDADGGEGWIDVRRREFFENPKNVDPSLWAKAKEAAKKAAGGWQMTAWLYRKLGGKFS